MTGSIGLGPLIEAVGFARGFLLTGLIYLPFIGIFAWSALEPREGEFTFEWLDTIMDKLAANDAYAVLATPSGSTCACVST